MSTNNLIQRRLTDKLFTILCIDDDSANLKILASIFKNDYKIIICKTAEQGLNKAIEIEPDLILLDVIMPGVTGFDLIKKLKSHPNLARIPVIFLTGQQSLFDEEKGLSLGACDYIQKPFSYNIVRARVNTHLEIVRQRKLLEKFAHFDSLTELPNRRKWDCDLAENWQLATINKKVITLGIADIDFFKNYNDLYGHQLGDIALRKVAHALKRVLFDYHGQIYRCGGEEFYFYLPEAKPTAVNAMLQECLASVASLEITHQNSSAAKVISVSLGAVITTPGNSVSLEKVINHADKMLYKIKNTTRNGASFMTLNDTDFSIL